MDIDWVSAIMEGPGIDPLSDEAIVLLPTSPEDIEAYLQAHPGVEIVDLDDSKGFFQAVFHENRCDIFDIISIDCSLSELNTFLNAAIETTAEQFGSGVRTLLALKQRHFDGKVHTADMLWQADRWNALTQAEEQNMRRVPMNFFTLELKKIVGPGHPGATYAGRACYIPLGDTNRAKLEFVTQGKADHYEALRITILNRQDGLVDQNTMLFRELIDVEGARNECFRRDIPYAWTYNGTTEWYAYQPTAADYRTMGDAVDEYLGVFQELGLRQSGGPAMGQQMS